MMTQYSQTQGISVPTEEELAVAFTNFESQGGSDISAADLRQIVTDLSDEQNGTGIA